MEGLVPRKLTDEAIEQLRAGIALMLSRWKAVQDAIEEGFGGRNAHQKLEQLPVEILSRLTQTKEPLYLEDLEDMLDEFMLSLEIEFEDDSIPEVAYKLMDMREECSRGNFISIERLKEAGPRNSIPQLRQARNNDDDVSADMVVDVSGASPPNLCEEDMMVDEPQPTEVVEADGWTLVSRKKNRDRRN